MADIKQNLTNVSVQTGIGLLITVALLFVIRPRTKEGGIALGILVVVLCNLAGMLGRFVCGRIRRGRAS